MLELFLVHINISLGSDECFIGYQIFDPVLNDKVEVGDPPVGLFVIAYLSASHKYTVLVQ